MPNNQWTTYWSRAQRGLGLIPTPCLKHQHMTLKAIPQSHMLRLRFAAFYETQPIEITNVYLSDSHNHYRLFFQGQEKVTLKPQDACWSDGIDIHEMNQSALTLDYDIVVSPDYHFVSGFERMDYDVFKEAPQQIYALNSIELQGSLKGCLCVFGDSIVEQGNYTRILQEKAMEKGYSLINLGLSGNRLLRQIECVDLQDTDNPEITQVLTQKVYQNISIDKQCFGISGLSRFIKEAKECHQVYQYIIAIGVNDLYQPGTFCALMSELPTLEDMQKGYMSLSEMIQDIPTLWCEITPFINNPHCTKEKEERRQQINLWLNQTMNQTICFDNLTKEDMNEDGLHPNLLGGKKMAKEIEKCLNI
ncbi:SGNH/GDSL hydrolase family protein [Longibaculum muris]|uniref:SGNH/GDSL hydrolase family protein n=1 Tax=Longibaculum muris TaxID=1796628 RepID=UPI0022E9505B|nr:SGNH/GDSL hydrolase family protein [Longibaculum muris]